MLQFDDMAVELLSFERTHEGIVLVPRRDIARAASNWSLLSSLAFLSSGLETSTNHHSTLSDEREHLNKRRKLVTPVSDIMQRAIHGSGRDKLAALHFLYFLCDQSLPLPEDFETTMLQLNPSLLSDDSQIVVWTMLVLSR